MKLCPINPGGPSYVCERSENAIKGPFFKKNTTTVSEARSGHLRTRCARKNFSPALKSQKLCPHDYRRKLEEYLPLV